MPNWFHNVLQIIGPADDALALRTMMTTTESDFDFNAILPMPAAVRDDASHEPQEREYLIELAEELLTVHSAIEQLMEVAK